MNKHWIPKRFLHPIEWFDILVTLPIGTQIFIKAKDKLDQISYDMGLRGANIDFESSHPDNDLPPKVGPDVVLGFGPPT